jgi:phosphoglycerate dehydrogenase-like enzyme
LQRANTKEHFAGREYAFLLSLEHLRKLESHDVANAEPVIVVEDDVFTRLIAVVLDPRTSQERIDAFRMFMAHDEPDFDGWCERLRATVPGLVPSDVRLVSTHDELLAALPAASRVVVESLPIGAVELAAAPELRLVQKFGTVLRNVDVTACAAGGVIVRSQRRRANVACAEWVMMAMLALSRKLNIIANRISPEQLAEAGYTAKAFPAGHTARNNWGRVPGLRVLYGATLGLIGFGEIGREIARHAAAFGMRVLYTQRSPVPATEELEFGVSYSPIDELLGQSDFVSIQLPFNESTRGYLDSARLDRLKPGAFLVNVARAELVERDAILAKLKSGRIGGFALDPLYDAPGRSDDELLTFDNVILTPHIGAQPRFNALDDLAEIITALSAC